MKMSPTVNSFCNKCFIKKVKLYCLGSYCPLLAWSVSSSDYSCTLPVFNLMASSGLDSLRFWLIFDVVQQASQLWAESCSKRHQKNPIDPCCHLLQWHQLEILIFLMWGLVFRIILYDHVLQFGKQSLTWKVLMFSRYSRITVGCQCLDVQAHLLAPNR